MLRRIILVFFLLSIYTQPALPSDDGIPVDELLTEVQKTLIRVRDGTEEYDLPPLNKVTLQLKSSLVEVAKGKVSLFIIEFGANVSEEAVQSIMIELTPPSSGDAANVSNISDALADSIISTAVAVKNAEKGEPPLELSKLIATVRFVVSSDGEGGVKLKLLPITVDIGGKVKSVATQEIILEFSKL